MKKEDCNWSRQWNRLDPNFNSFKYRRNETIIIPINQLSAQIFQTSLRGGATDIIIPPNLKQMFKSLYYFDITHSVLSGRYRVEIDDHQDDDIIFVYRKPDNSLPNKVNPDLDYERIIFRDRSICSPEEVMEYNRKLSGYITLLNHRKFDGIKIFSQRTKT